MGHPAVHAIRSVLREGISNILRHSGATRAEVRFDMAGGAARDRLTLTVADNGRGLGLTGDVAQIKGNGLRNLRARSDAWDGAFRIAPRDDGTGCLLRVTVPLKAPGEAVIGLRDAGE